MLAPTRSTSRHITHETYVCLNCRLRSQRRQWHDGYKETVRPDDTNAPLEKRRRLRLEKTDRKTKKPASVFLHKAAAPEDVDQHQYRPWLKRTSQPAANSAVDKHVFRKYSSYHESEFAYRTRPWTSRIRPNYVGINGSVEKQFSISGREPSSKEFDHGRGNATFNTPCVQDKQEETLALHRIIDSHLQADHRRHHPHSIPSTNLDVSTEQALASLEAAADQTAQSRPVGGNLSTPDERIASRFGTSRRRPADPAAGFAWHSTPTSKIRASSFARHYFTSGRNGYATAATAAIQNEHQPLSLSQEIARDMKENPHGIRAQLRKWQELHGHEENAPDLQLQDDIVETDEPINNLTRLPDETTIRRQSQQDEEERQAFPYFAEAAGDNLDGSAHVDARFLKMGDLVEITFHKSERESMLAVYVQDVPSGTSTECQFFTMQGRWMHLPKITAQYSIPGWISPKLVEPLLKHLPSPDEAADMEGLMERAYMEDLSVPRDVAAPVVKRLLDFYNESQEIYRRHANVLDNAHDILAHETDLRYGSLVSAATTLLQIPSDKLPLTALFTVRKALTHGGFAFNMDRRSHRLTGYMQIRSKEQVKMVEEVRGWLRQWQEDLAFTAGRDEKVLRKHKPSRGAQIVYSFLEKARAIVARNRENRQPTGAFNVGPSNVRLPLIDGKELVRIEMGVQFDTDEQEIIRFLEAWCCSNMFDGLPRVQSLPPLLVQATGLYEGDSISMANGFMFLQELGTIMPYENRVRFDQHLLLPSSQHSKPLQNLMSSLLTMKDHHNFQDSMATLRHDWKNLPVYCIDNAGAHEIDDGLSIEAAGTGEDGLEQHWVHMHIANPTAFFSRDHPLAKMARHMGETIYMPERTYMMLPRWATNGHFSLAPNRPCLTFSAKMDSQGRTIEHKITPGIVRNTIQLTPEEIQGLLGTGDKNQSTELVMSVGGDVPTRKRHLSRLKDLTKDNIHDLRQLETLAEKRAEMRKQAGGVFFNSEQPDVTVWQNSGHPGLAWDHPHRKGSRIVEGDPVIEIRTQGLQNWFAADASATEALVRECMLLACEIAAAWCAERQIPIIYRGTVRDPSAPDPKQFRQEIVDPATKPDGSYPMHIGLEYIKTMGQVVLRTKPRRHDMLGMQYYSKVTSPLRRYGDMILHWQIEAALRHEAETGKSLVAAPDAIVDRSFLPFSTPVLDTIMLGLQPREQIIMRSKAYASAFWQAMLLFRKHHFMDDGGLPFKGPGALPDGTNGLRTLHAYVYGAHDGQSNISCIMMELNMFALMDNPAASGLDTPRKGDIWEVEIRGVNVYFRTSLLRPVRLVGRDGAGML